MSSTAATPAAKAGSSGGGSSAAKRKMLLVAASDKKWAVIDEEFPNPTVSAAPHSDDVQCVAWSSNNKFVTTGGLDGKIVISSLDKKPAALTLLEAGPQQPIHTLAFSKNSNTLAYGDGQGIISLFDLSKKHVSRTINGYNAAISSLCYDKGSEQLVFGDRLGNVGLYNELEDSTFHLQRGPSSAVTQVAFSRARRNLVAVSQDGGSVNVFDTTRSGHVNTFSAHTSKATGVAFYPNDKLLMSSGYEGTVVFYDLLQMKPTGEIKAGTPLTSIALRMDGTRLAVGCLDGKVQVYDIRRRDRPLTTIDTETHRPVVALAYQVRSQDKSRSRSSASSLRRADTSAVSASSARTHTQAHAHTPASSSSSAGGDWREGTSLRLSSIPESASSADASRRLTSSSGTSSQQFRSPATADTRKSGAASGFQSLQTPARSSGAGFGGTSFRSKVGLSSVRPNRAGEQGPPQSSLRREVPMSISRPQRNTAASAVPKAPTPASSTAAAAARETGAANATADESFAPPTASDNRGSARATGGDHRFRQQQQQSQQQKPGEYSGREDVGYKVGGAARAGERPAAAYSDRSGVGSGVLDDSRRSQQQQQQQQREEKEERRSHTSMRADEDEDARVRAAMRPETAKAPFYLSRAPDTIGHDTAATPQRTDAQQRVASGAVGGGGVTTAEPALTRKAFEAMQSTLLESVRGMIDAAMMDLRFEVQRDVHNMHLEMFRQFEVQKREVQSMVASQSVRDDVIGELEALRNENQQLRLRLDAQHIGSSNNGSSNRV